MGMLDLSNDDKKTRFYTGMANWATFLVIFNLCKPAVELFKVHSLSLEDQLILTLMRLRLNLHEQDLAYRFSISQSTVSTYITKWIDVMYVRLARNFMLWPGREELLLSMPMCFRSHFKTCVSIIDCFEIPLQRFLDLHDRASTFSSYKGRATVKFLISITPQGTISYISQAYGGRSTDVHITGDDKYVAIAEDVNFFSNLIPGDQVLADRGFLVGELIALTGAELVTPAFKGRRQQLTQLEVENSRRVSNVRIHVERVIGNLKRLFSILEGVVSINQLRKDEDGFAFIDKIAFVCCCLHNAQSSVIPFE